MSFACFLPSKFSLYTMVNACLCLETSRLRQQAPSSPPISIATFEKIRMRRNFTLLGCLFSRNCVYSNYVLISHNLNLATIFVACCAKYWSYL